MKVSGRASQSLAQAQQAQVEAKNLKEQKGMAKTSGLMGGDPSAQVSLSQQAQRIKQATDIAKDDSINEAKVAALQSMIDSGKYKVDSAAVADRLVDEHLKMPT